MIKNLKSFHDLGFALHLLRTKSKAPIDKGWSKTPRKPWGELKEKFKPDNNIGVVLGSKSKIKKTYLAVIDCDIKSKDPKHKKELNKALKKLVGEISFPTVISGRGNGSKHLYFRSKKPVVPKTIRRSKELVKVLMPSVNPSGNDRKGLTDKEIKKGLRLRAAWEISLMGEGQQVVLPPSIHPDSGKPYEWKKEIEDIKDIPILDLSKFYKEDEVKKEIESKHNVKDFLDVETLPIDPKYKAMVKDGEDVEDRSSALYSFCLHALHHDVSEDDILNVLTNPSYYLGQAAYDHAKTNDRNIAIKWVKKYSLKKALDETSQTKYFTENVEIKKLSKEESSKQEKSLEKEVDSMTSWKDKLSRNFKDGSPKATHKNIRLIIENSCKSKDGVIAARNTFSYNDEWLVNTPWGSKKGEVITDDDIVRIKDFLANRYRLETGRDKINDAVLAVALKHSYHPVRDYLESLEWDGKERLKTWLQDYLGAKGDPEVLECFGERTLIGLVKRIFEPGCKFDTVLILEGKQDMGKSSAVKILASEPWFSDSTIDIGNKDAVVSMTGNWILELGELAALSKRDTNELKQFISRSSDKMRPHYGKRLMTYPRQSIFIGTTNDKEYLKDPTGNRRYWPVKVTRIRFKKFKKERDQLLAEAKAYYLMGFPCFLDPVKEKELYKKVQAVQKSRMEKDILEDELIDLLDSADGISFDPECFRIIDLFKTGELRSAKNGDMRDMLRISKTLLKLGYVKRQIRYKGVKGNFWAVKSFFIDKYGTLEKWD